MAKRQRTRRVSPTPQGTDSFIEIRELTVGEAKAFQERAKGNQNGEVDAVAMEALSEMVIAWDWVDDDGQPLPQPHNNPDVFDLLIPSEIQFITEALGGDVEQKKARKLR